MLAALVMWYNHSLRKFHRKKGKDNASVVCRPDTNRGRDLEGFYMVCQWRKVGWSVTDGAFRWLDGLTGSHENISYLGMFWEAMGIHMDPISIVKEMWLLHAGCLGSWDVSLVTETHLLSEKEEIWTVLDFSDESRSQKWAGRISVGHRIRLVECFKMIQKKVLRKEMNLEISNWRLLRQKEACYCCLCFGMRHHVNT